MAIFRDLHRDAIAGTIGTFDRLIFKGHLNALFPQGAFKRYLDRRGTLLKDAGSFFEAETARLKAHAKALADDSGRPFVYLNAAHTHATGTSKESLARRIAENDGVTQGLVCAFSTLEPVHGGRQPGNQTAGGGAPPAPMSAFLLVPDRSRVRLDACPSAKLGTVFDPGLRQWPGMAGAPTRSPRHRLFEERQQDHLGCRGGPPALRKLHPHCLFLDRLTRMVNPLLPDLQKFGAYWWAIDQCEYATDLLFKERGVLETVRDDLVAMTGFGAVLRFLDRKPHPAFTGEVTIDRKTRPEG